MEYRHYDAVPAWRQQWFFWICLFILPPLALLVLLTGDVYYRAGAEVRRFGALNRLIGILVLGTVIAQLLMPRY
ncbi:hypothetical protein [Pseudomarimonas salicorniae]|uniref:Uncharacterized protein n=1 Tax=Pseudomarimonas salicorniae TaxID=2933270 RepID=A0ABT0GCL6_9GAMM|nr:hypothetical protein [Lysobacter sp. CAU 1642]MCK7592284.1 hypothetical protein [Lysobacter sp. CAU 1642]